MQQAARRPAVRIAALAWPILVGQLAVIGNSVSLALVAAGLLWYLRVVQRARQDQR